MQDQMAITNKARMSRNRMLIRSPGGPDRQNHESVKWLEECCTILAGKSRTISPGLALRGDAILDDCTVVSGHCREKRGMESSQPGMECCDEECHKSRSHALAYVVQHCLHRQGDASRFRFIHRHEECPAVQSTSYCAFQLKLLKLPKQSCVD